MIGDPTLIATNTTSAHVASSGHDFGIALDSFTKVWTTVVHVDGTSLRVEPPVTMFQWWLEVVSDIAWNGNDYVVAFRYQIGQKHAWLGMREITSPAIVVTETGSPDVVSAPAIACNAAGQTLAVISEIHTPESAHVRGYFESELSPMPSAPSPPTNLRAVRDHNQIVISWDPVAVATGFLLYANSRYTSYVFTTDNPTATTLTIPDNSFLSVELRAFNAAAVSSPVDVDITGPPRRRATR